jgi:hypothetical protein
MRGISCTRPVEVLEVVEHLLVPQAELLEVLDEVGVDDRELAGEVGLDVQVLVVGSMDWETPTMLEIVAVGAMAMVLELRMPCLRTALRGRVSSPSRWRSGPSRGGTRAPVEQVRRCRWAACPVPLASPEALSRRRARRPVGGGEDGVVGDQLHAGVGELDRGVAGVRDAQEVEGVLEAHEAEADRAVPQVGGSGLGGGVVVDVDDVVEHAQGDVRTVSARQGLVEPAVLRRCGGRG